MQLNKKFGKQPCYGLDQTGLRAENGDVKNSQKKVVSTFVKA